MKIKLFYITCIFVVFGHSAYAHNNHSSDIDTYGQIIPLAIEENIVTISEKDGYRYIEANGIPNHETGDFPSQNNPNTITAQSHTFKVPIAPTQNSNFTSMQRQPFGVALNGIPFDPATAECWGVDFRRPPPPKRDNGRNNRRTSGNNPSPTAPRQPLEETCEWNEEAILHGKGRLGLDNSNAHVQPNGTYHYHGIPNTLVTILNTTQDDLVHVGYAADGFKIYVSLSNSYMPSYQLKKGNRPSTGPEGEYDGTYTKDFEYVEKSGDLDEANGIVINEEYVYILTNTFPYVPRFWKGTPDKSFQRTPPSEMSL